MPQLIASCTMFSDHKQSKVEANNKKDSEEKLPMFGNFETF